MFPRPRANGMSTWSWDRECSGPDGMPITSTRPVNSSSPHPATISRNAHAPICSPTRSSPKPPRIMPIPAPADRFAARDRFRAAGLTRLRRTAGPAASQFAGALRTQRKQRRRAMARAMPGARRRDRSRRTHAHYRMEADEALPAFAASTPKRAAPSGSAGDAGARGTPEERSP